MLQNYFSTISSGLNSLSAVTLQDLVRGICFKNLTEERATLVGKILGEHDLITAINPLNTSIAVSKIIATILIVVSALVYGAIMIALTFVAAQLGGVLQVCTGV